MSNEILESVLTPDEFRRRQQEFGGGSGGGGGDSGSGASGYTPKDLSGIFALLQEISEGYFSQDPGYDIPEDAIRELHVAVFGALARSTRHKARLIRTLQEIATEAPAERQARHGAGLTREQVAENIRRAARRVVDCFFPK